jgi:hypothetical protein
MDMLDTLAYTITSPNGSGVPDYPQITIGGTPNLVKLSPNSPVPNSYWFCVLDAKNPATKVAEFVVAANNNTQVPDGLDKYMTDANYIIALATQSLSVFKVPQGNLYTYLKAHGAGRELDRLEQMNVTYSCGNSSIVSYVLTTQGGSNFGYELGSDTSRARYLMSLRRPAGFDQPYALCEAYTF